MQSLWEATSGPRPDTHMLEEGQRFDVVVIGGGFTGLTAALHLAERGRSVAVVEARTLASGASGVNAGFVVPNFAKADPARVIAMLGRSRGERLLCLVGHGATRVFETIERYGISCDARQAGWLHVAHSKPALAMLEKRAAAWCALGRDIGMLDAGEARHQAALRHCEGALHDPTGGTVHPLDYAFGLARAAIEAGARIHERAPAEAVRREGDAWRVETPAGSLRAGSVLLCTNAFATGVARPMHARIVPLRVYQVATMPIARECADRVSPQRKPVADTRANLFTVRLDRDDRLISGGMAVVPAGAEGRVGRAIMRRLQHELALPEMPEIAHVWHGTAAMTMNFIPQLHVFGPGFYGGIGCNGRGIAMTAMLGEVLADAAEGADPAKLAVPVSNGRNIPFQALAAIAPSFAVAQARYQDWREGL